MCRDQSGQAGISYAQAVASHAAQPSATAAGGTAGEGQASRGDQADARTSGAANAAAQTQEPKLRFFLGSNPLAPSSTIFQAVQVSPFLQIYPQSQTDGDLCSML